MRYLALVTLVPLTSVLDAQAPVIAVWNLDETSGFVARDSGPLGNHGNLFNFTNDPMQWVGGVRGSALAFDGVDDYVELPVGRGLPFYDGHGAAFSISMWVNGAATDDDRVLCLGSSVSNTPLFSLGTGAASLNNTTKLRVYVRNDAGVATARYSSFDVFDNTWHHIVYTETSGQGTLYVDGVRDPANFDDRFGARGTRTLEHGVYTLDKCALGTVLRPTLCCYYQGVLDDVQIYGFPLTPADVQVVRGGGVASVCRSGIGEYGVGCGPGPLDLYATGSAMLGGPGLLFSVRGGRVNAPALLCFGVGPAVAVDLAGLGYPQCRLYTPQSNCLAMGVLSQSGTLTGVPFPIPNIAALACYRVVFQALDVERRQADFSNAIVVVLGN